MSKHKGGQKVTKQYLGFNFSKREIGAIDSVVGMTFQNFGASRRTVHSAAMFWRLVKVVSGFEPKEDEIFINSIFRIRLALQTMGPIARNQMVACADRSVIAELLEEAPAERTFGRQPRQPRAPRANRARTTIAVKGNRPSTANKDEFYASWEWRTLRMQAIKKFGRACQCCGGEPGMLDASGKPVRIVVDHIKPISKYWNLRLELLNLQILCDECNQGKGNWDETDLRPDETPDEWVEPPFEDVALDILASMAPANGRAVQ